MNLEVRYFLLKFGIFLDTICFSFFNFVEEILVSSDKFFPSFLNFPKLSLERRDLESISLSLFFFNAMPNLIFLLNILHSEPFSLFKTFLDLIIKLIVLVFAGPNFFF